jgi:Protein of unknown function (DUF1566)
MQKNMPKLEAVLMAAVMAAWMGALVPPAFAKKAPASPAPVAQTGQTQCWDANGNLIHCTGTGQDGEIQAGVEWPTPRFIDNQNGTVTDQLTGLIWLKNANCVPGGAAWADALTAANTLAHGHCGLTDGSKAGDWRLPNVKELLSLIDVEFYTPALSNAAGTAQWREGDAFLDVQTSIYWTSTTFVGGPDSAWSISLNAGDIGLNPKYNAFFAWPVREGP